MQDTSFKQQTKQKYKPNQQHKEYRLTQPWPSEEKQTNKTNNSNKTFSTNHTLYKAYTNHWTKFRRAETKRKKEFNLEVWEKETSNTVSFKKIMKWQRNTTQMKEQIRNTEVQVN